MSAPGATDRARVEPELRPRFDRLVALLAAAVVLAAGGVVAGCGDSNAHQGSTRSAATSGGAATTSSRGARLRSFLHAEFAKEDSDRDGVLDGREATAAMKRDFHDADVDHDGVITIADVKRSLPPARRGRAAKPLSFYLPYDANRDGKITEREYLRAVRRSIQRPMDRNHDGKITAGEALAFHMARAQGKAVR